MINTFFSTQIVIKIENLNNLSIHLSIRRKDNQINKKELRHEQGRRRESEKKKQGKAIEGRVSNKRKRKDNRVGKVQNRGAENSFVLPHTSIRSARYTYVYSLNRRFESAGGSHGKSAGSSEDLTRCKWKGEQSKKTRR